MNKLENSGRRLHFHREIHKATKNKKTGWEHKLKLSRRQLINE